MVFNFGAKKRFLLNKIYSAYVAFALCVEGSAVRAHIVVPIALREDKHLLVLEAYCALFV
jgi:hypothetical protein